MRKRKHEVGCFGRNINDMCTTIFPNGKRAIIANGQLEQTYEQLTRINNFFIKRFAHFARTKTTCDETSESKQLNSTLTFSIYFLGCSWG